MTKSQKIWHYFFAESIRLALDFGSLLLDRRTDFKFCMLNTISSGEQKFGERMLHVRQMETTLSWEVGADHKAAGCLCSVCKLVNRGASRMR